jgi:hypothetical protein
MQMKRAWRFGTVALLALIVASVYAQPPLDWQGWSGWTATSSSI